MLLLTLIFYFIRGYVGAGRAACRYRIGMITPTLLAMSTGAMTAIIIGAGLPIFLVIVYMLQSRKKGE